MIEMKTKMVALDQNNQTVVILMDNEEKMILPIWIGFLEAQAIALPLRSEIPPRPLTHDLFITWCHETEAFIEKIVITDITPDQTYLAEIHLTYKDSTKLIDSRPSDAIALALRSNANIYMATKLTEYTRHPDDFLPEDFDEKDDKGIH